MDEGSTLLDNLKRLRRKMVYVARGTLVLAVLVMIIAVACYWQHLINSRETAFLMIVAMVLSGTSGMFYAFIADITCDLSQFDIGKILQGSKSR